MKQLMIALILASFFPACVTKDNRATDDWTYIAIDSIKQKWGDWQEPEWLRYFGFDFGDVNRDGNMDIISGRYIYKNPGGSMESGWDRISLDENVDCIFFIDADGDPFADIIAQALPGIYWYEALDLEGTRYQRNQVSTIPPTGHVNSQGFEKAQILSGGKQEILIASNESIYCITIPEDPTGPESWPTYQIAKNTSDEGIGVGDIDNDGDLDISCGRRPEGGDEPLILVWYENPGNLDQEWEGYEIGRSEHSIDRVEMGDLDGDGNLEIVVSEERYPGLEPDGFLLWFSRSENIKDSWERHVIVQQYSMNSLDLADFDQDGHMDIVTNEHKGDALETQIWLNDGTASFTKYLLDTGQETHLCPQVVDIDGDGDLDIAGCAWDNYRWMHLWRNNHVKALIPGGVFREYSWTTEGVGRESFLRVGGKMGYATDTAHFPIELIRDGYIRLAEGIDLKGATQAELVIERLQSHESTNNLQVSLNQSEWKTIHEPHSIQDSATYYMFHFYPRVNVPLDLLKDGSLDFKLRVGDFQEWGWPQNLIYGLTLKVYYNSAKSDFKATISGIESGGILTQKNELALETEDAGSIRKVDYIAFCEDINWPGDGKYRQWQYHPHLTKIRNHIGTSETAPFAVEWDTEWLPDQEGEIELLARVETMDGLIHYTEAIDGLRLDREYSVKLLKPTEQPQGWSTRADVFTEEVFIDTPTDMITDTRIYWKSWCPCYLM